MRPSGSSVINRYLLSANGTRTASTYCGGGALSNSGGTGEVLAFGRPPAGGTKQLYGVRPPGPGWGKSMSWILERRGS